MIAKRYCSHSDIVGGRRGLSGLGSSIPLGRWPGPVRIWNVNLFPWSGHFFLVRNGVVPLMETDWSHIIGIEANCLRRSVRRSAFHQILQGDWDGNWVGNQRHIQ